MYADNMTDSMQRTIDETNRRREKQVAYNEKHGITPTALKKSRDAIMNQTSVVGKKMKEQKAYAEPEGVNIAADPVVQYMSAEQLEKSLEKTKKAMEKAAKDLDFFEAAKLRDEMYAFEKLLKEKESDSG